MLQLDSLLANLMATAVIVPEDHHEVQAHVPSARDVRIKIRRRDEDDAFARRVGGWLLDALRTVAGRLDELLDDECPPGKKREECCLASCQAPLLPELVLPRSVLLQPGRPVPADIAAVARRDGAERERSGCSCAWHVEW